MPLLILLKFEPEKFRTSTASLMSLIAYVLKAPNTSAPNVDASACARAGAAETSANAVSAAAIPATMRMGHALRSGHAATSRGEPGQCGFMRPRRRSGPEPVPPGLQPAPPMRRRAEGDEPERGQRDGTGLRHRFPSG